MAEEKKAGMFNASARDGVQYRKASLLEMILGNANNGCGICFYLLMMYASYIANEGYAIAPAIAGIIITGTRIFDGVTDALFAAIFEKMNPKHGKIRIFLVVGWIMASAAVISGVYNFLDKLITSLASTIAAFCITFIGYKNTVPQMGDPATNGVFWMTMFLMFGLPIIGWLCNVVAMSVFCLWYCRGVTLFFLKKLVLTNENTGLYNVEVDKYFDGKE